MPDSDPTRSVFCPSCDGIAIQEANSPDNREYICQSPACTVSRFLAPLKTFKLSTESPQPCAKCESETESHYTLATVLSRAKDKLDRHETKCAECFADELYTKQHDIHPTES